MELRRHRPDGQAAGAGPHRGSPCSATRSVSTTGSTGSPRTWCELRNLADVAMLIVESARHRKESRGLHYLLDYLQTDEKPRDTVLTRGDLE